MFPRINTALSTYLKNPRNRKRASLTLAVAAAAAGMGTASAASSEPWIGSLNTMALAAHARQDGQVKLADQEHPAPGNAGQSSQAGVSILGALRPLRLYSDAPPPHAAAPKPVTEARPAKPVKAVPVKAASPAKPAAAHKAAAHKAPAHKAKPAAHHAASHRSGPTKPYRIYDSVTPSAIPSGQERVAVYGNGPYQASWGDVRGRQKVLWIDTNGDNSGCDVLDVEPGDATPSGAAAWAKARLTHQPNALAIIYTMRSEWQQVKSEISGLPGHMQSHVRYWIADPTGVPHVVPGSSATQWYWGSHYDITTALPEFNH